MVRLKGSYTVEAALLSGVWLLVIFASLLLILGSYGKVGDALYAEEAVLYGSFEAAKEQGDGTAAAEGRLSGRPGDYTVSGEKEQIQVRFEGMLRIPYGNLQWKRTGTAVGKVLRPAEFIAKIQKARKLKEAVTGD